MEDSLEDAVDRVANASRVPYIYHNPSKLCTVTYFL